jgi:hypothetical protein
MLYKQFRKIHNGTFCELDESHIDLSSPRPSWEDWIYAESQRR